MAEIDKTIEVIKAAMEKEKSQMNKGNEAAEEEVTLNSEEAMAEEAATEENSNSEMTAEDMAAEDESPEDKAENTSEDTEEKPAKQGKSFFKSGKNKELAAKDAKIEELTDRIMRTMAEFDNYRKRTEKEKSQMFDIGVKSVIEKLLPVVDNFERGLGAVTDKDKENAFVQGMEMIYKQLMTSLEEIGVKPIEALGKEFDPALHNAVMHGEDESMGENIISDEFQKGYIYRDIVVRHSMVKVVN